MPSAVSSTGRSSMSASDYLLASAEASMSFLSIYDILSIEHLVIGAVTALLTNPIWVVKVRLFTTNPDSPNAYKGLLG